MLSMYLCSFDNPSAMIRESLSVGQIQNDFRQLRSAEDIIATYRIYRIEPP